MKCIVLAGGTDNSLWPLARQKYPKQFMPFRENRSLFQENIVRNMTFCDEFLIITHKEYEFIVESQMRALQGVQYQIMLEECNKRTALPILVALLSCEPSEEILVIGSDTLVEGNSYQEAMIESKHLVEEGKIVIHGIKPVEARKRFAYVLGNRENIREIIYQPDNEKALEMMQEEDCYWNSGIIMGNVGVLLEDIRAVCPEFLTQCQDIYRKLVEQVFTSAGSNVLRADVVEAVEALSIVEVYLCKSRNLYLLPCDYSWTDIGSLRAFEKYLQPTDQKNVLKNNSDATVINRAGNRLVVVNGVQDAIVVNTDDAVYVTTRENADDIRSIVQKNHDPYVDYFDYNTVSFRDWGTHELLRRGEGYKVKKVTVAPGMEFPMHKHEYRSEQWTVVSGTPTITLGRDMNHLETKDYQMGDCIAVPIGTLHKVRNNTLQDVEIVEVAVGHHIVNSDVIRLGKRIEDEEHFVKLSPAYKDYLWGGTRIRDELGKDVDKKSGKDILAESWELSAHADGVSKIASGSHKGMYFNDYLEAIGKEALGWKCQHYDRFPILVKFIDAKSPLSIQIHPDDEYALKNEGEYGKNEMWYIMDCNEDAFIYYGTKGPVTKEEIRRRIEDNTILEVLNKVPVHKGDVFYVKAGTIHAIGEGILICEIQQSSNCTYRLYDYDRRDKFGNPRELHIKKAVDVVSTFNWENREATDVEPANANVTANADVVHIASTSADVVGDNTSDREGRLLVQCKYFECKHYTVKGKLQLAMDETSFRSVMVVKGAGTISDSNQTMEVKRGDSIFVQAVKEILTIEGDCEIIVTHV